MSEDCRRIDVELDRVLSQPASARRSPGAGIAPSESALAHLRECERCRQLYQWLLAESLPPEPAPGAIDSIQARLKQSLAPVKPQASPRMLAARFLLLFLTLSALVIGMMGTGGLHAMNWTQLVGISAVLVCGAALLSFSLAWQMSPGSLYRESPGVAVLAAAGGFLAATSVLFPWREQQAFVELGRPCLVEGLLVAAPASFLFWILARRGYVRAGGSLGATLGAIAGLIGASVFQFVCKRQDAAHLTVWHGGIVICSLLLGIFITRSVNTWIRSRA